MTKLRWRMPDEGKKIEGGDPPSLARAFGHFPITLRPEHERELRAMAALWGDAMVNGEPNPYYFIANLISNQGTIVLFLDDADAEVVKK